MKDTSEAPLHVKKIHEGITVVTPHHQRNIYLNYETGPFANLKALIRRLQQTIDLPVIGEIPNVEAAAWDIASVLHGPLDEPTQDSVSDILEKAGIKDITALNSMLPAHIHSIL